MHQINIHRQMVTKAAKVARPDIGTEKLFAVIGFIVLQHKVSVEDAGTTILVMKSSTILHQCRRDNDLVKDLPIGLVFQCAFEA